VGTTFETVREIAAGLPEVTEGLSFDTPSLKVRKKGLAWLRHDGVLVLRLPVEHREALIHTEPDKYFLEPHYLNYPSVLVRLEAVDRDELADLMEDAWRAVAPKRLAAAFDAREDRTR